MSVPPPSLSAVDLTLERRVRVDHFALTPGQCIVLCGPNGSGKSSLLRLLAGLERPHQGQVLLDGRPLHRLTRMQIAERVAWLPQRSRLSETMTCEAIVAAARFRFGEVESTATRRAKEILEQHELAHLIGRLASRISGGELQRVLITTLIAQDVPYLLVDEPANHLDPHHQVTTYRRLGQLFQSGKGIVIVSHDVRLAALLGARDRINILCMNDGCIQRRATLADADLVDTLSSIYRVPFVPQGQPGELSVNLSVLSTFEGQPEPNEP